MEPSLRFLNGSRAAPEKVAVPSGDLMVVDYVIMELAQQQLLSKRRCNFEISGTTRQPQQAPSVSAGLSRVLNNFHREGRKVVCFGFCVLRSCDHSLDGCSIYDNANNSGGGGVDSSS